MTRHLLLKSGVAHVVVVLSLPEMRSLLVMARLGMADIDASPDPRSHFAGATIHASGQSGVDAARRAYQVMATIADDLPPNGTIKEQA